MIGVLEWHTEFLEDNICSNGNYENQSKKNFP